MTHRFAAALLLTTLLTPTWAAAQDIPITLKIAGEAYQGPPAYSLGFGPDIVAQGSVDNAIDTESAGPLNKQNDWTPYTTSVDIAVPAATLAKNLPFDIRLTNDKFGGAGTGLDRNLYVTELTVDGQSLPLSSFTIMRADGTVPVKAGTRAVSVSSPTTYASVTPPAGGWPGAAIAETTPANTAPALPAAAAAPPADSCDADIAAAAIGFDLNASRLTGARQEIDALIGAVSGSNCALVVTGYASQVGSDAINRAISLARAQAVQAYLEKAGIPADRITVVAGGPTNQFGATSRSNQRVVISTPAN